MNITQGFRDWLDKQGASAGSPGSADKCPLACFLVETFDLAKIEVGTTFNGICYEVDGSEGEFHSFVMPPWAELFVRMVDNFRRDPTGEEAKADFNQALRNAPLY